MFKKNSIFIKNFKILKKKKKILGSFRFFRLKNKKKCSTQNVVCVWKKIILGFPEILIFRKN